MTKHRQILVTASLAILLALFAPAVVSRADIYEWQYINPGDPGLGKQQSTTLAPDGVGAAAVPGANLSNRNLTKAYLIGADLSPSVAYDEYGYISAYRRANLTSATLTQAELSNTWFNSATLTGADLTGAEIRGANFDRYDQYGYSTSFGYGTGITFAQLASTASFAALDLSGVSLGAHNLIGANFTGFNLTDARFADANLTNVNFSNANLTGGVISGALTGMNLSNAEVRGARLWGVTKAQLYSTASYQAGDLTGLTLYSDQTGWNFAGKNLSQAMFQHTMSFSNSNFAGANLSGAYLEYVSLQSADLSNADLRGATLSYGNLTGADFTGADVQGARLSRAATYAGSGLTNSQLVSTASYQAHDLAGIRLRGNILTGANLAGQNLRDADLVGASLGGAELGGAEVRGAQFHRDQNNQGGITPAQLQSTASYQFRDLSGIGLGGNNLAGVNLAAQNLANATFESESGAGANLTGADLSHANLSNAKVGNTTLAGATLVGAYLGGLDLRLAEMSGANLRGADASSANFGGYFIVVPGEEGGYYHFPGTNLASADLSSADLTNAWFAGTLDYVFGFPHPGANLTNANLSAADARGANFQDATLTGANTTNLIQSNGHIAGLDLTAGASLIVRDYNGPSGDSVPIIVDQYLASSPTGTLRVDLDADHWGSTISFAPSISVALGGKLELAFAPDVNPLSQLGRTFDLFDWSGVVPAGAYNVSSLYTWDLSRLYTTGEVTLFAVGNNVVGDFNGDGTVSAADLNDWKNSFGTVEMVTHTQGDADGDQDVDGADFLAWQRQLGLGRGAVSPSTTLVPEPGAMTLAVASFLACFGALRTRRGSRAILL